MGEAREVMNRATEAMNNRDMEALEACYAPDVVATTPDAGELHGSVQLIEYMRRMVEMLPDFEYTSVRALESGDAAIDVGIVTGTNSGPLLMPDGTSLPATGKQVRLRSVDIATVSNGRINKHDFYFDQMEMMLQLDLLKTLAAAT